MFFNMIFEFLNWDFHKYLNVCLQILKFVIVILSINKYEFINDNKNLVCRKIFRLLKHIATWKYIKTKKLAEICVPAFLISQ